MKIEVGDIVRNSVARQTLKNKTQISKEVGISRNQLNNILGVDEMEIKYVMEIGKSINFDFSKYFKEMATPTSVNTMEEPEEIYHSLLKLREKYEKIMEDHIELQNRHIKLQENFIKKNK